MLPPNNYYWNSQSGDQSERCLQFMTRVGKLFHPWTAWDILRVSASRIQPKTRWRPSEKNMFGKCSPCPWPLNLWPWKCHHFIWTWYGVIVTSVIKIHPCIPEIGDKCPAKFLFTISGLAVTFTVVLLTSKSNQVISDPNCTELVNLVNSHTRFITC